MEHSHCFSLSYHGSQRRDIEGVIELCCAAYVVGGTTMEFVNVNSLQDNRETLEGPEMKKIHGEATVVECGNAACRKNWPILLRCAILTNES